MIVLLVSVPTLIYSSALFIGFYIELLLFLELWRVLEFH